CVNGAWGDIDYW
nr:immunoglobulin heavy chain junction region [Macaca mulatta]MOW79850.1 immunoglobulin heavy chain junction region [Macaca mulatta]MOW80474.1 immunoglobulin heavy chain junction region [Macaca mulatta]MOW84497.1 immunoglobulin heavy chain junction region [Macaca mulatta]